MAPVT